MPFEIRPASDADLPTVASIYNQAVEHSTATFDTVPPGLEVWRQRLSSTDPGDVFLVASEGAEVIGFAYSSFYRPRPAYGHTRETTVYLAEAARGRGVGTALYAELHATMLASGAVRTAIGVVALPNYASERLHLRAGYVKVGHLTEVGHKFGQWVDVAIYQAMLDQDG
jgi:phosphinothricin acetyltransferase